MNDSNLCRLAMNDSNLYRLAMNDSNLYRLAMNDSNLYRLAMNVAPPSGHLQKPVLDLNIIIDYFAGKLFLCVE